MAYECPVCFKQFEQRSNFIRHKNKHDGKMYTCDICFKQFNDSSNLKKHVNGVHIKKAEHQCKLCSAKFKQKTHLQAHQLTHSSAKEFSCGVCGKEFSRKKVLETHMRTHTQDKLYQCSICPMAFNHKSSLEYHVGKHTGNVAFTCDVCGRKFDRKSNFVRHTLTHSDEKPHNCSICAKGFIQKVLLENHMQKFHQVVQDDRGAVELMSSKVRNPSRESYIYECEKCHKKFNVKGNLNRHVRDKHEDKPGQVVCNICMNTYVSKKFLEIHLRTDHNVSNILVPDDEQSMEVDEDNKKGTIKKKNMNSCDPLQVVYSSVNIDKLIQSNETEQG